MLKILASRPTLAVLFAVISLSVSGQKKLDATVRNLLNSVITKDQFDLGKMSDALITDDYTSQGIRHIYINQTWKDIEIEHALIFMHYKDESKIYFTNQLITNLTAIQAKEAVNISAIQAIKAVSIAKNYNDGSTYFVSSSAQGPNQDQIIDAPTIAFDPIHIKLKYLPTEKNNLQLCWEFSIFEKSSNVLMNYFVNAANGEILRENIKTISCEFGEAEGHDEMHSTPNEIGNTEFETDQSHAALVANSYNVFQYPVESPNYGVRSTVITPWLNNPVASPAGWHNDGTISYISTKGNNVDAYEDSDNTNSPTGGDAARAVGGSTLDFNFPWDSPGTPPATYQDAAITNLFFWGNLMHDVWYNYGFDEPSGNFQKKNYTNTGLGNDFVNMEAQDGSGTCNANYSGGNDGSAPRVQMYLCNGRDGDFDNMVIAHEYGHGISIRLTGGPANSNCLNNQEQMGEGWSDWLGAVMTIEPGDLATDARPVGTWLFGQGPTGAGIRPYPYSTSLLVNPMTYATIAQGSISVPHGVGSVWATMLWDMTWDLIAEEGWDPDIYNGDGGNNIAMNLVIEGMKLQPCSPGFVDGRNAILEADSLLYDGAHTCLIWNSFARRGLGYSASQGSSGSRSDGVQAFDKAPDCSLGVTITASTNEIAPGDIITYSLKAKNNDIIAFNNTMLSSRMPDSMTYMSASNGGYFANDTVYWPSVNINAGDSVVYTYVAQLSPTISPDLPDFFDNVENGTTQWIINNTGSPIWSISSLQSFSPTRSWRANDPNTAGIANLIVNVPLGGTDSSFMTFKHRHNTELHWDGGVVDVSLNGGATWIDLGNHMSVYPYNDLINNSRPAFSGNSSTWKTTNIDLSAFDGYPMKIRFQMNTDVNTGTSGSTSGWFIDDVSIINNARYIPNRAKAKSGTYITYSDLFPATKVVASTIQINLVKTDVTCFGGNNGTAIVNPTGGNGTFTIAWSTGATGNAISGLIAGTYSVTVTSGATTKTTSFVIGQATQMTSIMHTTDADDGNNGSASVFVSGGTPGYTYLWSTGSTTSSVAGLSTGIYFVTIKDTKLCTLLDTAVINNPFSCENNLMKLTIKMDQFPQQISYNITNNSGDIIETGGPYGYLPAGFTLKKYFCLDDGCFTLRIFDNGGDGLCNGNSSPPGYFVFEDVYDPDTLGIGCNFGALYTKAFCRPDNVFLTVHNTDVSCNGNNDGSAMAVLHNTAFNPTYRWSNSELVQSISNLSPGSYTVTVTYGPDQYINTVTIHASPENIVNNDIEGAGSIRQVVAAACANDTITFSSALDSTLIKLTSGEIAINKNLFIIGNGIEKSLVSGQNLSRLFNIQSGKTALFQLMKLRDGQSATNGGALLNNGTTTLKDVLFIFNNQGATPKSLTNLGLLNVQGTVNIK